MSLLNIITNKKTINKKFRKGDWIHITKKQNLFDNKITEFDGLIFSIKKKNINPTIKIIKKYNNVIIKRIFFINCPLIINYKLIKSKKYTNNIKKYKT
ncbi:50S ribosomal protein L19 [Candidatus Nasuia deltocephalinicola]|uniref:50S ribosomal protein L19 n=1 Tax=Candidatus Nasuia deltocephalincola TaxID=1160784 RepID=UPI00216B243B|nr:50S ribosomal protein L19 [Candidatus Nasuia deltocephalinicola]